MLQTHTQKHVSIFRCVSRVTPCVSRAARRAWPTVRYAATTSGRTRDTPLVSSSAPSFTTGETSN